MKQMNLSESGFQRKIDNQWHCAMRPHIGADADSGLVHSAATTVANAQDVTQMHALLHGEETDVVSDSRYQGVNKREEVQAEHPDVSWHVAMAPGKRTGLDMSASMGAVLENLENSKACIQAELEHTFRVIKLQFCLAKVIYWGVAKNTGRMMTLVALSNIWIAGEPRFRMARR
jgi:IS5 family transposase